MPKKHTHEYVFNYYKEHNYNMISIYQGRKKDKLICSNNHDIEMYFHHFKSGHRCKKCYSESKKLSQDYVYNYYKKHGYILKSIYKNCEIQDELLCPNNHDIKMTFNNFKNQKRRCQKCYFENNTEYNHFRYNSDRTRQLRMKYLSFDLSKIKILKDEPLYNEYIESQKKAKLSENVYDKSKYNIDHIFPRKAFIDNDLDIKFDKKIIKKICNCKENLQIITLGDNLNKSCHYDNDEFLKWFYENIDKK